ncbi:NO-inducible flavohemoprotein [Mucilaginibacter aquatilis]|uniref:Flavohemoprotein n=1 Tax=Mucilaginibacter aquatilis TaxID=1517760 RepID=A0A6I4IDC7_9SPHI|nr:NO-inducible flavohemoprotein [Mucilaginibacter aquatilis]MVN91449.1 NO-inducible flavohemoprotein [Mucilaginibacter aquatilis]
MTTDQKALITATVPILRENGLLLTKYFYNRMFIHHPDLKNIFNMGNQKTDKQQMALAMAVLAYAENIADPKVLMPVVDRIGHKHVSLDIRPEHYRIVGHHLLASIQEVLRDAATPDIVDAWTIAYNQLAAIMSGHESGLYQEKTSQMHGWTGWRPFKVERKVWESEEITSFYLVPVNGGKVARHVPGQFISLRIFLPEMQVNQARQYSLSSAPDDSYYRISVKRELGKEIDANGMISNRLHDHVSEGDMVDLTAPAGNFVLPELLDAPVTLISGGVGLTPLLSMLYSLVDKGHPFPITWLHGCRNERVHAFKKQVAELADQHAQVRHHIFYDLASETDQAAGILNGFLDIQGIDGLELDPNGHYFLCGPSVFISKQYKDLVSAGINKDNIHFEEFGPQVLSLN